MSYKSTFEVLCYKSMVVGTATSVENVGTRSHSHKIKLVTVKLIMRLLIVGGARRRGHWPPGWPVRIPKVECLCCTRSNYPVSSYHQIGNVETRLSAVPARFLVGSMEPTRTTMADQLSS